MIESREMNENDSKITESRPSAGMSIITSFSSEFDPSVRSLRYAQRYSIRNRRAATYNGITNTLR